MDVIIKFFTEKPSDLGIMYIVFGCSLLTYIIFRFLPEEKSKKVFFQSGLYDWSKYDYSQTIKKNINFALALFMFSSIILVLNYVIGDIVAYMGVRIFFPLALVLAIIRGNVVKKKE